MKWPDEVKLALVTAACIIVSAIVFKNVLHIQPSFTISPPFLVFIVYLIIRTTSKTKYDDTLYWGLAIVIVTILTILLYAF
jgi:hypothetical protein